MAFGKCCWFQETPPVIKNGILYETIRPLIKPLDIIAFRCPDMWSDAVFCTQAHRDCHKNRNGIYTHIGIVVSRSILYEPEMENDKLYLLESAAGGDNVLNIHGKRTSGVQIKDLDKVIEAYDKPNNCLLAWCPLLDDRIWCEPDTLDKVSGLYAEVKNMAWDANPWSLCSALYPCLRPCRPCVESTLGTEDWLFCSELVAVIYKELGILPSHIEPKDVVPDDLINPNCDTDKMPIVIRQCVAITTTLHKNVSPS